MPSVGGQGPCPISFVTQNNGDFGPVRNGQITRVSLMQQDNVASLFEGLLFTACREEGGDSLIVLTTQPRDKISN